MRLYAQLTVSKHHALDDALLKAKARSKHWEREAKVGAEKTASAERERDEAKEEAQPVQLAAIAVGDVKALAEDELARVQNALAAAEEARLKLPTWRLNDLYSCRRSGRLRMKCLLSILRRARTKRSWRRTTKRP